MIVFCKMTIHLLQEEQEALLQIKKTKRVVGFLLHLILSYSFFLYEESTKSKWCSFPLFVVSVLHKLQMTSVPSHTCHEPQYHFLVC